MLRSRPGARWYAIRKCCARPSRITLPYYHFEEQVTNYADCGPQHPRGFRVLKEWLALKHVGAVGYRNPSPLISLRRALQKRAERLIVIYRKSRLQVPAVAIASGVEALDLGQFVGEVLPAR